MRQILYASISSPPGHPADITAIVEQSRHNNALDGVTGLLWSDGARFLQVIEGPAESVVATYARIVADPRHEQIALLSDTAIIAREFGGWALAFRPREEDGAHFVDRIRRLLHSASPQMRDTFLDLVEPPS